MRWNCAATFVTGVGSWGSHPTPRRLRLCWRAPRLILKLLLRSLRRRQELGAACQHLYNQSGDQVDVKLAARRAYEEDAYLSNADVILSRLFYSSYDLGQFSDAARWCDEGKSRFPENDKFVECRLLADDHERAPSLTSRSPGSWRTR